MNGLKTINVLEMMKEYNIEQKKVYLRLSQITL